MLIASKNSKKKFIHSFFKKDCTANKSTKQRHNNLLGIGSSDISNSSVLPQYLSAKQSSVHTQFQTAASFKMQMSV